MHPEKRIVPRVHRQENWMEIHSTTDNWTSIKKNNFAMTKNNKMITNKNTGNLRTTMVDTIKSSAPIVVKGVAAIGIVMMVVTATYTIGQLFK